MALWNGPAQGMIDPGKVVDAAEKRIAIGISTRQQETTAMTGGDFDSNVVQLAREEQMMREAGLSGGKKAADREADGKEEPTDGQEDEDKGKQPDDGSDTEGPDDDGTKGKEQDGT